MGSPSPDAEADLSPLRPRGHLAQVPPVCPGHAEPQSSGTAWGVVVSGQERPWEGGHSRAEATLQGCWTWQQCTASVLPWVGSPTCGMEGPLLPVLQSGELDPSSRSALKMEAALPPFLERKSVPSSPGDSESHSAMFGAPTLGFELELSGLGGQIPDRGSRSRFSAGGQDPHKHLCLCGTLPSDKLGGRVQLWEIVFT